jgi:hypothetical protein
MANAMNIVIVLLIQAVIILLSSSEQGVAAPVLAFGDLRGHLEPCGCDPRTDVGGLKRIAAAIGRYRAENSDLLVLHTGNVHSTTIKDKTEADGLSRAVELLRPDASLLNESEWINLRQKVSLPRVKWVVSNAKSIGRPGVEITEVISKKNTEIFGYLGTRDKELMEFDKSLLARWQKLTKLKSATDRVLIYSGSDRELHEIVQSKFFGLIISANTTKLGVEKGDQEQRDEQSLARQVKSQFLAWSVPYGGGGLLRQGGLEMAAVPKTLAASLSLSSPIQTLAKDLPIALTKTQPIHWLRGGEESGAPEGIIKVFDDVRQASRNHFQMLVQTRSKDLPNTAFAGAESCAGCHKSSYDVWLKSKHASAMMTLLKRSRHEDAGCVSCHVVGFEAKGGYVNEEKSPHFANVQCESCHGPRKAHVENPLSKPVSDAKASCAECHTPPHSPGFEVNSYWKMIEHK